MWKTKIETINSAPLSYIRSYWVLPGFWPYLSTHAITTRQTTIKVLLRVIILQQSWQVQEELRKRKIPGPCKGSMSVAVLYNKLNRLLLKNTIVRRVLWFLQQFPMTFFYKKKLPKNNCQTSSATVNAENVTFAICNKRVILSWLWENCYFQPVPRRAGQLVNDLSDVVAGGLGPADCQW